MPGIGTGRQWVDGSPRALRAPGFPILRDVRRFENTPIQLGQFAFGATRLLPVVVLAGLVMVGMYGWKWWIDRQPEYPAESMTRASQTADALCGAGNWTGNVGYFGDGSTGTYTFTADCRGGGKAGISLPALLVDQYAASSEDRPVMQEDGDWRIVPTGGADEWVRAVQDGKRAFLVVRTSV